jgi:2-dehydropantoate 2-reductase
MTMRVGVLGPGGVGGLLAAVLAREGADVVCIATPTSAAAINEKGLSVRSERFGNFTTATRAESQLSAPVDVLCIAVKATSLNEALAQIPAEMVESAIIVPFLNGVEHIQQLREHFASAVVVAATIRIESSRDAPGDIVQRSPFAAVDLAPSDRAQASVGTFAGMLADGGFDVRIRDDENAMLWEKLSFIAPLALLTTAYRAPAGVVRTMHREALMGVVEESAAVANAVGVPIDPAKLLAQFDGVPPTMESSMQRDAVAGHPLEVEAIGGAVLRYADQFSVAVPTMAGLVSQLRTSSPDIA